jgi:pyrimidine-nucleoside phosphorylase
MTAYDIIKKKREKKKLSKEELEFFLSGFNNGEIPDYQMSSLLMAIFLNGMDLEETINLTKIMLNSGEIIDFKDINKPKLDKHSTGGVGDKISLILAPIIASLDIAIPMISGRALGHSGGTLDKLESIPGFNVNLNIPVLKKIVKDIGCALIGQSSELVPLDKKIYALRDVTATVENIPLICSSILSKKIAEGIDGLVLDVKVGSGAFMKDLAQADALSKTLCDVGKKMGKKIVVVLTDMNEPIGKFVGNSLEVIESIQTLKGFGEPDILEISEALGVEMLLIAGKIKNKKDGKILIRKAIENQDGLKKFKEIIKAQGGEPVVIDNYDLLPRAKFSCEVKSDSFGFINTINTETIGLAANLLGAGRSKKEDIIDYGVGFEIKKKIGNKVEKNESLIKIYYNDDKNLNTVKNMIKNAYHISNKQVTVKSKIIKIIK